jgi:hypothetical protein
MSAQEVRASGVLAMRWTMVLPWLAVTLWLAIASDASCASWDLRTDDTELRICVATDQPVIERLAAVGAAHNWLDAPAVVPLMSHVWLNGQETPLAWKFRDAVRDEAAGKLTLSFVNAEPQLTLRSIWQARGGRGPIEHRMELDNGSSARVTVSHQDSLTLRGLKPDGAAELWWIKRGGGNATEQGGTFSQPLAAGLDLTLASDCTDGASPVPWLAVQVSDERGLYVGWEFSGLGRIQACSASARADQLDVCVGLHPNFKTDVEPNETFLVPAALVGCYRGDLDEGSYSLHRFVLEKLRPPMPQDVPDPVLAYNLYLDVGGNKATEADVLRSAAVCRDLGFEYFMPDAMWFPETGDWRWDPRRFPQGIAPIEQYVHGAGMKLALWCAWTNGGVAEHPDALSVRGRGGRPGWFSSDFPPDWQPGPFYGGLVCLGCDEAQQWATRKTQWLVKEHKLDYLKHDINPIVTQCNKSTHRHHYGVDTSYWAALGYYQVQRRLREVFPELILENCSGGGHIKDFGVMALTHYIVATDTLSNLPDRQAIYDSTRALPPLMLQCYTYDNMYPVRGDAPGNYLWRSAMMGAWQIDPTDTPVWTEEQKAVTRRSVEVYRQWIRPLLADVKVHHVLPRPDGVHWDGMFYWNAPARRGTLFVWRPEAPDAHQTVRLKGLAADKDYWLWSEDGSVAAGVRRGAELMSGGVAVELSQPYSSDIVFVQDAELGKPAGLELPQEFALLQSEPHSGVFQSSVSLKWQPAAGARSYQVMVAEDPAFHSALLGTLVTQPATSIQNLAPGKTYYWRAAAISWGGCRAASGAPGSFVTPPLRRPAGMTFASDVPWTAATAGADNPVRRDVNYYGKPIAMANRIYPKSLWTHAFPDSTPADVIYDVTGKNLELLKADVGLDDASGGGSVQFQVWVDGQLKAESPVLRPREIHALRVPLAGARQVTLRVLNGGDGYNCDHAAWGNARFLAVGTEDPVDN